MNLKDNTYPQVYVDLTSKCNLNCSWCCNSKFKIPDITKSQLENICSTIPDKVEIRFLGGEPTVHSELFDLIDITKKYRHMVTIITNGVKFADINFCKEVKKHGPLVVSVSMDSDADDQIKLKAIENLHISGYKRIVITTTITESNIDIIKYFRKLTEEFSSIRYLHFRNMINDPDALTFKALEQLVMDIFPEWNQPNKIIRDGKSYNDQKCCGLCQLKWITPQLQVMVLDSSRVKDCHLRGYVDNETLMINPFFKEIKRRNNSGS